MRAAGRFKEAVKILAELDSAAGIAEFFRDIGITGTRGDCDTCPVANFLLSVTGPEFQVNVNGSDLSLYRNGSRIAWERTPTSVCSFIEAFDQPINPKYPPCPDSANCDICRDQEARTALDTFDDLVMVAA